VGARFTDLIVDAIDPRAFSNFWSAVLGWPQIGTEDGDVFEVGDPSGLFQRWSSFRSLKPRWSRTRLHIDANPVGCDQDEESSRLLDLGAHKVDIGQGEQRWVVLADPEGNEFCLLATRRG
jgi:hypothetical protein